MEKHKRYCESCTHCKGKDINLSSRVVPYTFDVFCEITNKPLGRPNNDRATYCRWYKVKEYGNTARFVTENC